MEKRIVIRDIYDKLFIDLWSILFWALGYNLLIQKHEDGKRIFK